jgi:hypothetical protein
LLGQIHSGKTVSYSAEEMLQNMSFQRLKCGKPATGLPSRRLVTRLKELSVSPKSQYRDNRKAILARNYGQRTVKRKYKKQNIIPYAI